MTLRRQINVTGQKDPDMVFRCQPCGLEYLTEDHDPIYGAS